MGHHHHHHNGSCNHHSYDQNREGNKKGLLIALLITSSIMLLEFFGGLFTNSLALLSDSGHMLSDSTALLLSFLAILLSARAASSKKTFGFYRFEIVAAFLNGLALFAVAAFIVWEAIGRLMEPPEVASGTMMLIASVGLFANLASAWSLLSKGDVKNNINLRAAYLHVLSDALGSLGAMLAGLLMLVFEWYIADPLISIAVAVLILRSGWGVIKQSLHVLMEGSPEHINTTDLHNQLQSIPGVLDVHDLHIWTLTSDIHSISCHIAIQDDYDCQDILQQALNLLKTTYGLEHATIQMEKSLLLHDRCRFEGSLETQ